MTSIIIASIDEAKFQSTAAMYRSLFPNGSAEIIRIEDARSLAEAYNRGIHQSKGEQIILAHDDVEILSPVLADVVAGGLENFDIIGVAGTTHLTQPLWLAAGPPHIHGQVAHRNAGGGFVVDIYSSAQRTVANIQAMDGLFLALHRRAVGTARFDEKTFDGFHLYDLDFTYSAHRAGLRLAVCCDIQVLHTSVGNYDQNWQKYADRFLQKHAGKLTAVTPREFSWGWVKIDDKAQIRGLMTPPTWK
jgi:GT2 family glycosyltransferase